MIRWSSSILWFLLLGLALTSANVAGQTYHFQHYSLHNGLGQSQVSDIAQDRFGYIWMGTRGGGLSRFDGLTFKTYRKEDGLIANNIGFLEFDNKGRLFISSVKGFCVFNGQQFTNLTPDTKKSPHVRYVFADRIGNVFAIFNRNGIGQVVNEKLEDRKANDPAQNPLLAYGTDEHNNLYVSDWHGSIFRFTGKTLEPFVQLPTGCQLIGFMFDNQQQLWLSTNHGTFVVPAKAQVLTMLTMKKLLDYTAETFKQAHNGDIWIGLDRGVARISKNQTTFFNESNGFTDSPVKQIFEDREGVMWFATEGDGAYKFTDPPFTSLSKQNGLNDNSVSTLQFDKTGKLWIGLHYRGLNVWDGQKIQSVVVHPEAHCQMVSSILFDDAGNQWVALSSCGILKIDTKGKKTFFDSYNCGLEGFIFNLSKGEGNDIWICTAQGLYLYNGKSFRKFDVPDGLKAKRVWKMQKIATNEFIVFTPEGLNRLKDYKLSNFPIKCTNVATLVTSVAFDPQRKVLLWGDWEEGIFGYNFRTQKTFQLSKQQGLSSNLIYNLIFDRKGYLWVGTEKGLDRITLDDSVKIKDIRYFGESEGLVAVETNANATTLDAKGDLWVGTIRGTYRYQSEKDVLLNRPQKVQLTEVKLNFDTTQLAPFGQRADLWHEVYQNLELPFKHNNLIFRYVGISHRNSQEIVYQYKLEGFDKKWSAPTQRTEVTYTNLPPGAYTFLVRAANDCGVWCPDITRYAFNVLPPFYQTWWFSLLTVASLVGAVWLFNSYRIRVNVKRMLELERVTLAENERVRKIAAQDLHDEFGNTLTRISLLTEIIKKQLNGHNPEVTPLLIKISDNTQRLYQGTKDFIWAINPEHDNFYEIAIRLKDFGDDVFDKTGIRFNADGISEDLKNVMLPMGYSRHLIFLFKEAISNTLKHSKATETELRFAQKKQEISIEWQDNGAGFELHGHPVGNGLQNIRIRAKKIGGNVAIDSHKQAGTQITFSLNIPQNG